MAIEQRIIRLTPDHPTLPFDCGDADLNDFLTSDAKAYQEKLLAVTYLVESAGKTVLYYCLSNDKITNNKTGCRFITVDAYRNAVPFYQKNGFKFMGTAEKDRYEKGKDHTIAMFFDLLTIQSVDN